LKSIDGVRVEQLGELGVSGATRRVGNLWIVLVNQDEARVRNRFTIAPSPTSSSTSSMTGPPLICIGVAYWLVAKTG
jgi:hypothetical protein